MINSRSHRLARIPPRTRARHLDPGRVQPGHDQPVLSRLPVIDAQLSRSRSAAWPDSGLTRTRNTGQRCATVSVTSPGQKAYAQVTNAHDSIYGSAGRGVPPFTLSRIVLAHSFARRIWPGRIMHLLGHGGVAAEWGVIAMRRLGMVMALGALLGMFAGVLTASPALAGRGHKWQVVPEGPFTLPSLFCGFKVGVTPQVNKRFSKLLKTSDGSMTFLHTGFLKVSFTNLQTRNTITENLSGPVKVTVSPDGSMIVAAKGHTGNVLPPADAKRFGLPTVSVTAGALTGSVAADGSITSLSLRGHVLVDVCAALS
jgi:hypothetical protein